MIADRGDDQRRNVDAEHGAEHEIEADQIADAIDKVCHRLLSVRGVGGSPSPCRRCRVLSGAPLDNSGQKVDIRARPARKASLMARIAAGFLVRLGVVPVDPDFRIAGQPGGLLDGHAVIRQVARGKAAP